MLWDGFSVFAAGKSDTRLILSFAELPEGVREQKVSVGTGREELELPEELTVFIGQEENTSAPDTEEADAGETNAEEDSTAENNSETGETQESADGGVQRTGGHNGFRGIRGIRGIHGIGRIRRNGRIY